VIYRVLQLAHKRLSVHDPRETIVLLALMSLLVVPALVVRIVMDAATMYRTGSLGNVMATLVTALISAGIALRWLGELPAWAGRPTSVAKLENQNNK
jgi:hypothetical protein